MDRGRDGVGSEDGVGKFEEGIGSAVEAFVERVAEGVESIVGFHNVLIMHSPKNRRILYLPAQLKRKLIFRHIMEIAKFIGASFTRSILTQIFLHRTGAPRNQRISVVLFH